MSVLRNRLANNFTQVPTAIFSSELSHGAVRIYAYLSTKPDGWKVFNSDIKKQCRISSSNTMAKYLKELVESGWIARELEIDKGGRFSGGYSYELLDEPDYQLLRFRKLCESVEVPDSQSLRNRNSYESVKSSNHSNTNLTTNTKTDSNINNIVAPSKNVAEHLSSKILAHTPTSKPKPKSWLKDIDLAIRIDHRTETDLIEIVDWIYTDGFFWIPHVRSGKKLREKYDTMFAQKVSGNKKRETKDFSKTDYSQIPEGFNQ